MPYEWRLKLLVLSIINGIFCYLFENICVKHATRVYKNYTEKKTDEKTHPNSYSELWII